MKKSIIYVALAAIVSMGMPQTSHAQSLLKSLKNAATEVASSAVGDATGTVGNVVSALSNLLGTDTLSNETLIGTWNYSEPCIVFESKNILTKLGTSAATGKIESSLQKGLNKIGFTKGKVKMVLNEDKSGNISYNGKGVDVAWEVKDSNLILTFPITQKSISINVNMNGSALQMAMKADNLISLLNIVTEKASAVSTALSSVSSLIKTVDGAFVGLRFEKGE